jgi:hypothetical protein
MDSINANVQRSDVGDSDRTDCSPRHSGTLVSDQTRLASLIEVCLSVAIGFTVSYTAWPFVAALYDIPYSHSQNLGITGIFTVLSITRGYVVRRFFERGLHNLSTSIARMM